MAGHDGIKRLHFFIVETLWCTNDQEVPQAYKNIA